MHLRRRLPIAVLLSLAAAPSATAGLLPLPALPPIASGLPAISGTAKVGEQLSCTNGTWLNSPTSFTRVWLRGAAKTTIAGSQSTTTNAATPATYTLTAADENELISCRVSASNSAGSSLLPADSLPTGPVEAAGGGGGGGGGGELGLPPVVVAPLIDGTPQSGRTVTCRNDLVIGATGLTYGWQREGAAISGAAAQTYTLTDAEVGKAVTCSITATNAHGSASGTSLPVFPVAAGLAIPLNTSPPTITGTPRSGSQLTCLPGSWLPSDPAFSYQWNSNGGPLEGATAATFPLTAADVGRSITCTVTATNDLGTSRATSAAVIPAADPTGGGGGSGSGAKPVSDEPPELSGRAVVGEKLSCTEGSWSGEVSAISIRWVRGDKLIAGAVEKAYTLTGADRNQRIACAAIAGNSAGHTAALSRFVTVKPADGDAKATRAPRVNRFKAKPKTFRLGSRREPSLRWRQNEAAAIQIVVERRTRARKWKRIGTLTADRGRGKNKLAFASELGQDKLRPGRYRAAITATDADGNKSKQRRTRFRARPAKKSS